MTIHYFGADISPRSVLYTLAGKHFCVSFEYSGNTEVCHRIGSSVMLDNGAYTFWRNHGCREDWTPYYDWVRPWLEVATTWAVIPDVIDGDEAMNNQLIGAWYHALATTAAPPRSGTSMNPSHVWNACPAISSGSVLDRRARLPKSVLKPGTTG